MHPKYQKKKRARHYGHQRLAVERAKSTEGTDTRLQSVIRSSKVERSLPTNLMLQYKALTHYRDTHITYFGQEALIAARKQADSDTEIHDKINEFAATQPQSLDFYGGEFVVSDSSNHRPQFSVWHKINDETAEIIHTERTALANILGLAPPEHRIGAYSLNTFFDEEYAHDVRDTLAALSKAGEPVVRASVIRPTTTA